MILDTTFLIDLERETMANRPGPAYRFLETHRDDLMRISVVTLGELAEGYDEGKEQELDELVSPYELIEVSRKTSLRYGRISKALRAAGARIGDNDIWIAASALEAGETVATRDTAHFSTVPGLKVIGY